MTTSKRTLKRIHERAILNRFISSPKCEFSVKSILQPENDPPDFILEINSTSVSVEVTQLINPDIKKVERFKDEIVQKAHEQFKATFPDINLNVQVTFKNVPIKGPISKERSIQDILKIVVQAYQVNEPNKNFNISLKEKTHFISNTIETCYVNANLDFDHWQTFGAYLVPPIESQKVVGIIQEKENALKNYRKGFDQNWLLIASELGTKSSSFHVHSKIYLETIFDKVFLLEYMPHDIITIK